MKKVLYVSLIALATLSLPSCGGENKSAETETTADTATLQEAPAPVTADTTTAPADTTGSTSADTTKH